MGGLTLKIGLLIFFDLFMKGKGEGDHISLQPLKPLLQREEERYGANHRQVGEAALKYWKFPQEIIDCQRFYLIEPDATGIPELALVCDMAREFSALICQKSMDWQTLFSKAEVTYRTDHDFLADIVVAAFDDVQEIAASFKVEMNKSQDILGLMEKANKALSALSERMIHFSELGSKSALPTLADLGAKNISVSDAMQAVVHEIRNPLTAIGGFARKLEKNLNPASDEWQYVRVIIEESARLEAAIESLLGRKPL